MRKGSTASSTICRSGRRDILVLAPNWLGDAVMATPFLQSLRIAYPAAFIDVVCREYISEIFKRNSSVDRLHAYDGGKGLRALNAAVARNRPGNGWHMCFVLPPSFKAALAALLSGSKKRIGYGGELRGPLLSDRLPSAMYRIGHLSEAYVRLIGLSGVEGTIETPRPVVVPPYDWERIVADMGIDGEYMVIAPGATYGSAKVWPGKNYSSLAAEIAGITGWRLVLVGSEAERDRASDVLESSGVEGVNLAGGCDISGLAAVLRGASLVIGNDSGPVHIASAMGRATVTLFGSTSPAWTAPRGSSVRIVSSDMDCAPCFERECPKGHAECLEAIGVGEVLEAALEISGR